MNHLLGVPNWRVRRNAVVVLAAFLAATVLTTATAPTAEGQSPPYETCAAYNTTLNGGGQRAADAAERLRAVGSPPLGIESALDIAIRAESDASPGDGRPSPEAIDQATMTLQDYFGPICDGLDVCPLIAQAVATNDASSGEAARLAGELVAPSPPGISVALSLIAGEITLAESSIHESVAEAQEQVNAWFMCRSTPTEAPPASIAAADVIETCADLAILGIPEGPQAEAALARLRERGAPSPAAIEAALDVVADYADGVGDEPSFVSVDEAYATLNGYFGSACATIDRCQLVNRAVASKGPVAQEAAELLGRLETPAPPGIGAALALIAGEISDSPFHESVDEAQAQIRDYYQCTGLAFTGPGATTPLASIGLTLLGAGAALVTARRRLERRG